MGESLEGCPSRRDGHSVSLDRLTHDHGNIPGRTPYKSGFEEVTSPKGRRGGDLEWSRRNPLPPATLTVHLPRSQRERFQATRNEPITLAVLSALIWASSVRDKRASGCSTAPSRRHQAVLALTAASKSVLKAQRESRPRTCWNVEPGDEREDKSEKPEP